MAVGWDWPKLTLNVLLQSEGDKQAMKRPESEGFIRHLDATLRTFVN